VVVVVESFTGLGYLRRRALAIGRAAHPIAIAPIDEMD